MALSSLGRCAKKEAVQTFSVTVYAVRHTITQGFEYLQEWGLLWATNFSV